MDAEVDGGADVPAVQGLDLIAEQVEPGSRSGWHRDGPWIVKVAVMAFRKEGDAVNVGRGEGLGEQLRVEVGPDVGDSGAGMKVEVDRPPGEPGAVVDHPRALPHDSPDRESDVETSDE